MLKAHQPDQIDSVSFDLQKEFTSRVNLKIRSAGLPVQIRSLGGSRLAKGAKNNLQDKIFSFNSSDNAMVERQTINREDFYADAEEEKKHSQSSQSSNEWSFGVPARIQIISSDSDEEEEEEKKVENQEHTNWQHEGADRNVQEEGNNELQEEQEEDVPALDNQEAAPLEAVVVDG